MEEYRLNQYFRKFSHACNSPESIRPVANSFEEVVEMCRSGREQGLKVGTHLAAADCELPIFVQ